MTRIVHAADLHIDSPLRGLERYEGAPVERIRGATRRACENLVDLCLAEHAELLLLAGDLFDGDWRDYATGLFFVRQMARLKQSGVRVVLLRGNHDAASQISKQLTLPDNVVELSTHKPQTVEYEDLGVAVHGQGYARRAITKDLAAAYPAAVPGALNIGLLHTCLDGRVGHEPYAPCALTTLIDRGYDYWALGHVHQREELSREPWVVFSGNLQGRHARETGPKGATLVTMEGGRITSVVPRPLDTVRWVSCRIDAQDVGSAHDLLDTLRATLESEIAAADGRLVAARVIVEGRSAAHDALMDAPERWENEIRAVAIDMDNVWIEKVRVRTDAVIDTNALRNRDDAIGQVARALADLRGTGQMRPHLEDLAELKRKIPGEVADALALDTEEDVSDLIADVERLLLPRLMGSDRT